MTDDKWIKGLHSTHSCDRW